MDNLIRKFLEDLREEREEEVLQDLSDFENNQQKFKVDSLKRFQIKNDYLENFLFNYLQHINNKSEFQYIYEFYKNFTKLVSQQKEWFITILKHVTRYAIDRTFDIIYNQQKQGDYDIQKIKDIQQVIGQIQSDLNMIKLDESKKKGILSLINYQFWIYFKISQYHQCKSLIQSFETCRSQYFEREYFFQKSEKLTYLYYTGRMLLIELQMQSAFQSLNEAFEMCRGYEGSNVRTIRRQILKYLIPVRIACGIFPEPSMLEEFELHEYILLSGAIQKGDNRTFKEQVNKFKRLWIKRGLFLVMEKLQIVLTRNLLKKGYLIYRSLNQDTHQIDLHDLLNLINWQIPEEDFYDLDEAECIIANLMYKKLIKGYISHEKKKIVFSKNDPFPNIAKNKISI